jgi:toxin-antitoxin system PIN domain toxin
MLFDISALLALLWENHEFHARAVTRFQNLKQVFSCPLTQLGFVRISSQPNLGFASSPPEAVDVLLRLLSDPRHRFIPDDVACDDRVLFSERILSAKAVTDHYLVALARQHKLALATFDAPLYRAFRHEPGLVELIP